MSSTGDEDSGMFARIRVAALLVTVAALATTAPAAAQPLMRETSATDARVVLAVVEPSINAYHQEFRSPRRLQHPSTSLAGYPQGAQPLKLTFGDGDLRALIAADDRVWRSIRPGQLYYVPGTRISGIVHLPEPLDPSVDSEEVLSPESSRPVIDGGRAHGTGVASVAAGTNLGTCPHCDIVVVAADDPETGLQWAAKQPWIDVISNSWGVPLGAPTRASLAYPERALDPDPRSSRDAARGGHPVVFASGNGLTGLGPLTGGTQHGLTWDSPFAGPPWVLTVGAAKAVTGQPTDWHNVPVDVIAQGEQRPAASHENTERRRMFDGTSCSAPVAAGVLAEALYQARRAAGAGRSGVWRGSLLSRNRAKGPLNDGRLTYLELFAAAKAVAAWQPFDPASPPQDPRFTPTTPASFVYQGYGLLDRQHVAPLRDVILGLRRPPPRPEMTFWAERDLEVRSSLWGPAPNPG